MKKLCEMILKIEQHHESFYQYTQKEISDFSDNFQVQIFSQNVGKLEQMQPAFEKAMEILETFDNVASGLASIVKELEKVAQILD